MQETSNKPKINKVKAGGPCRPDLNEERLKQMRGLASKVFLGEATPKAQCAEDVLYLVAEVRTLRLQILQYQANPNAGKENSSIEETFEHLMKSPFPKTTSHIPSYPRSPNKANNEVSLKPGPKKTFLRSIFFKTPSIFSYFKK
jgi:hypothetical protein